MDKKERKRLAIVFLVVLFLAFFKDVSSGNLQEDNIILRNEYGGAEKDVSLELEIEEENTAQIYVVEVEPMRFTREQANTYFEIAKEEISKDMHTINESLDIKEIYADGMIIAEWQFSPHGYIDSSGDIFWEEIPEEGVLLNVSVLLTGGVYEEIYEFPLLIEGKELSENELIVQDVDKILKQQMQHEGEDKILLPEKIRGKTLIWKEKKDYLTGKVFLLEGILLLLLYILKKREEKELIKKRKEMFEYGYPDLINKLCVLLGAGMTMRQAWICIARQYQEKKGKGIQEENLLYETIVQMIHRLSDGETEREAYEKFAGEIDIPIYRRLMRSLIVNLEKGTAGICAYLENEEKQAYEIRILNAKKLGEEASTKMLIPLMLQMLVVMAVVLAPAMIGFMS